MLPEEISKFSFMSYLLTSWEPMIKREASVGWKTQVWNLFPLQFNSWMQSPLLPEPNFHTLAMSSLVDARYSPEGSQHTEWIWFLWPWNGKPESSKHYKMNWDILCIALLLPLARTVVVNRDKTAWEYPFKFSFQYFPDHPKQSMDEQVYI